MAADAKRDRRGPIGVGLIGLGRAGWGMHRPEIEKLPRLFRIVAACDAQPQRCAQIARTLGCRAYTDVGALIADPGVELVDVASRTDQHVAHAMLALRAGKAVFVEKPMAVDYAGARRLAAAAKRSRGRLYVRHNRRFEPAFRHVRELIDSGRLGDVHTVKLCRGGFQRRADWQTILACAGGQLLNWGPHVIDHALQLLDAPVADMWSHLNLVRAAGDAEDHVRILLKGTNERVVEVQISGGVAIAEPECIVHGSRGSAVVQGGKIRLRYLSPRIKLRALRADEATPPNDAKFGNPETLRWVEREMPVRPRLRVDTATSIWKHLYRAIREGAPFPVTLEQSLAVMEIIGRAKRGTRFGPARGSPRGTSA